MVGGAVNVGGNLSATKLYSNLIGFHISNLELALAPDGGTSHMRESMTI